MEDILQYLPEHSMWEKELLQFANDPSNNDDLGHLMIYCCERTNGVDPDLEWLFEPQVKSYWIARCRCSDCGEELLTAKVKGKDAILLYEGEDSQLYEVQGDPAGYCEGGQIIEVKAGDSISCPFCGANTTLIHSGKVNGGREKRIVVETLETVDGHTALMYWMIVRRFTEYGHEVTNILPFMAEVITDDGRIRAYTHMKNGFYGAATNIQIWKPYYGGKWPDDIVYNDWGSINNRKKGAATFRGSFPDMEGTTGEKTGICQYLKAGGNFSHEYIKLWQKFPAVENLLNCAMFDLVEDICREAYRYSADVLVEARKVVDIDKVKPHEILGISKPDLRQLQEKHIKLKSKDLKDLQWYYSTGGKLPAAEALIFLNSFGTGMTAMKEMEKRGEDIDLRKINSYLQKQGLRPSDVRYLTDTRQFARKLNHGQPLSGEQLWPRRLIETHDRLSAAVALATGDGNEIAFQKKAEQLKPLEWTCGKLCITLPKRNSDLVREGEILRHCVGTYGESHLTGKDTIFFVRKRNKRNTPYYTLDIDMTDRPKRVQLHGYGNEHHGEYKQHSHRIPKEVLSFCKKWEDEVLLPWYLNQQKEGRKAI